jgi:DNA-binding CsgD family transcriptional regulator
MLVSRGEHSIKTRLLPEELKRLSCGLKGDVFAIGFANSPALARAKVGVLPDVTASRSGATCHAHSYHSRETMAHVLINHTLVRPADDLHTRLAEFANGVGELKKPDDVLNALHAVSTTNLPLSVLGAMRLPVKSPDWDVMELGRSAFLHRDVPDGWWREYKVLAKSRFTPAIFLAKSSLASFTWTELTRWFEPIGTDRWSVELGLKYGMRDGLTYGVGGRWIVAFWSRKELSHILSAPARILICAAASFAVLRLEQLAGPDVERIGSLPKLTPRELAALRMVSLGQQTSEIAQALSLGEETVRSHLKKAQSKLEAYNRTHAACQALRLDLIP